MNDFSKILSQAKELEAKMKESQEKIKNITVEGISGTNSVKVVLNGDGEITKIDISSETLKEEKAIISGHYIFSDENFLKLKEDIYKKIPNVDEILRRDVKKSISRYTKAFRLH